MKKLFLFATLLVMSIGIFNVSSAQDMNILEKDYEISRKAKKGYLGGVEKQENGNFDLIYFSPSTFFGKAVVETYTFDKDCNLLNTVRQDLETEKVRKRYKFFVYKGEYFIANTMSASTNYVGKLVFRKKQVTAKWDWWFGGYVRRVKMLDKVKPKDEDGKGYYFLGGAYEVERDSAILVMAMVNNLDTKGDDFKGFRYDLIKADNNLNIKVLKQLTFPYHVRCVFAKPLMDNESASIENDDMPRDWIVIYAPTNMSKKEFTCPSTTKYTYFRISPEGEIKEQFDFEAPASGWRIVNAYENVVGNSKSVILYGASTGKEGKYSNQAIAETLVATSSQDAEEAEVSKSGGGALGAFSGLGGALTGSNEIGLREDQVEDMLDLKDYTHFVVAKIENGKMTVGKKTEMEELNDKAVAPPDMKKPLKFNGKKFVVNDLQVLSDNSLLLNVQDYKKIKQQAGNKMMGTSMTRVSDKIYEGMFMLHFTPDGSLIKNYTVKIDQKSKKGFFNNSPITSDMFRTGSSVIETKNVGSVNWIMTIVKAIDDYAPKYSIEYGKLNLKDGIPSDFKTLGEDEKRKYYLYDRHNRINHNGFMYFFSETLRGDRLLLSRLKLEE